VVAFFNKLRKPEYEQVTKVLLFLKNIYNLKAKPYGAKAYEEEGHNTGA
jgi:hypothetical protein